MAVYDEKYAFRPDSSLISRDIYEALLPIFNKASQMGFTTEDIFYLMVSQIHEMTLDKVLEHKYRLKGFTPVDTRNQGTNQFENHGRSCQFD